MARVFSDLRDGSGRRYYYSLTTAPGGLSAEKATLTISGLAPTVFQQTEVFRTPATAALTLNGRAVVSDVILSPAPAALSSIGQIPGEYRERIITNSMPLDYTDLPDNAPTILFISTITPSTGLVTLQTREINVTQGGNIGFMSPAAAQLTLSGPSPTLIFLDLQPGVMTVEGRAPTLSLSITLEPETASMTIQGASVSTERPFQWVDVDAPPALTWTTTTGVAA